jgi:geranylgeranyl diphosphate synthase type I
MASLTTGDREVAAVLGEYRPLVDGEIAAVLKDWIDDDWMRGAIGYHLGWADEDFRPLHGEERRPGGKKLRAALTMLAYQGASQAAGTAVDLEVVLPFAAAVELLHSFSLVHDDIEDSDPSRHGRPTLATICGPAEAINVGDCLHALATGCLGRLPGRGVDAATVEQLRNEFSRTAVELAIGQHHDLEFETEAHVSLQRYIAMIERKTGALLRCSAYGGALLAAGPTAADPYAEFGTALGLAFQIRDDVLGIWGSVDVTGKPAGRDIRRKKKSLPVVFAFAKAPPPLRARLESLYAHPAELTAEQEDEVHHILDNVGAAPFAGDLAQLHRMRAINALTAAAGGSDALAANRYLSDLAQLATFATDRRS